MNRKAFFKSKLSRNIFKQRETALLNALTAYTQLQSLTQDQLSHYQETQLKHLLNYAYQSIPFYKTLYNNAGFHPDHFRSLADLSRVPPVTKTMLRQASTLELTPPDTTPSQYVSTSGSTGEPAGLFKSNASMWMFMAAAYYRYHQWCQNKPIRNVLYILDDKPGNIDYTLGDLLRTLAMENRFVSSFSTAAKIYESVELFRPEYISTYPSVIRNLSLFAMENRRTCPWIEVLNLTSEMLDTHTRHLISLAFPNARIIETYTSTEAGFMGYQCLDQGGFHLSEDLAVFELHPLENTSELNQLLVTDLTNFATPLIRYSGLNDMVVPADTPCHCGSTHLHIKNLQGRVVDSITLPDGSHVTPYVLTNIVSDTPGVCKYQIVQSAPAEFTVKIVLDNSHKTTRSHDLKTLTQHLQTLFRTALDHDVTCTVELVPDIKPKPGQHKVPLVISL